MELNRNICVVSFRLFTMAFDLNSELLDIASPTHNDGGLLLR